MISELALIATKAKFFVPCLAMVVLGVADANVPAGSLEDYTLKGMLTIALVFTVRLVLQQQKDHKLELAARDVAAHEERDKREAAMVQAMALYTAELKKLTEPIVEQASYFKAVVAKLIDRGLENE